MAAVIPLLYVLLFSYAFLDIPVVLTVIRWIFYIFAFDQLSYCFRTWIRTFHVLGLSLLQMSSPMLRLRVRRGGALDSLLIYVILLFAVIISAQPLALPLSLVVSGIIILLVLILDFMKPPVVLLLGVSRKETFLLHKKIWKAIGDLHVISLLEWRKGTPNLLRTVGYFLFRTTNDNQWVETMEELADLAHVLVVDVRDWTPIVVQETRLILSSPEMTNKAYFVKGDNGEQPALDRALGDGGVAPPPTGRVLTVNELLKELGHKLGDIKWAPWA